MANRYWMETQEMGWPLSLARLLLLIVAAILIVLIAGCHSAPSIGPDVRVDFEQTVIVPDCGQIRQTAEATPPIKNEPAPAAEATVIPNEGREIARVEPPFKWDADVGPAAILPPLPSIPTAPAPAAGDESPAASSAPRPRQARPPKHSRRRLIAGAIFVSLLVAFVYLHHRKGQPPHAPKPGPTAPATAGPAVSAPAAGASPHVNPVAAAG